MDGPERGSGFGWVLVIIGLIMAGAGLVWILAPGLPRLGRLPGDIVIERENGGIYFPITSCIVIGIVVSVVGWLVRTLAR
ncbi:MAG: DUF2905 domain-containing protein [Isosphaeraceae bacterium]